MRFRMKNKARNNPKRLVFPEGDEEKILRAAQIIIDEGMKGLVPLLNLGGQEVKP